MPEPEPVEAPKTEEKPKKEKKPKKKVDVEADPDAEEKESLEDEEEELEEVEPEKPEEPKKAEPVKEVTISLTQEEKMMANEIEDISEDLHAEQVSSNKAGAGKTSIAFMDPNEMGLAGRLLYVLFFVAFFAGVGFFFYSHLFPDNSDPQKLRRQALNEKRAASGSP